VPRKESCASRFISSAGHNAAVFWEARAVVTTVARLKYHDVWRMYHDAVLFLKYPVSLGVVTEAFPDEYLSQVLTNEITTHR